MGATQSNVCGGKYRVSHGSAATLKHYSNWQAYNLGAYTLDRSCLASSSAPKQVLIKHTGSNMCLNNHNNAQSDGATANLWTCNGHVSQNWVISGNNIKHTGSNMCLN